MKTSSLHPVEITLRGLILAVFLTILLALSNAYLALKLGILVSASIPAAIMSMGLLSFFKNATILENNAVQTAASAGEAVAGGIVYTIPALIIIRYWYHFDYFTCFFIAAVGGTLGVFFSVPLRRILVHDTSLAFPEGRAIAEVLNASSNAKVAKDIFLSGLIGALWELAQTGFHILASSVSFWIILKKTLLGVVAGFSITMIGAGYLVGFNMAFSIFCGAVLLWMVILPISSWYFPDLLHHALPEKAAMVLWNSQLRYVGIGAMLLGGILTLLSVCRPLMRSMVSSIATYKHREKTERTEKDLPFSLLLGGGAILALLLVCFFSKIFGELGSPHWLMVLVSMGYIFFAGFLFSVVTAYFSGMVGVSASPGSAVMIAGIVMAAWVFLTTWNWLYPVPLSGKNMQIAQAIVIMLGSMMMSIVAIANDNSQDLKVGQLVGATPYKQQWMLLLGVFLSAIVIPPVMEILFQVYGIAGVFPREGMDPSLALPAPTAAVMATITQAMFMHTIPWAMLEIGAFSLLLLGIVAYVLRRKVTFSILGIAVGMYLPLSSSVPLFLGGAFALLIKRRVKMRCPSLQEQKAKTQKAVIIACGLVAGSALMDVLLAIPFSLLRSPELLSVVQPGWEPIGVALSLSLIACLPWWINRRIFQ